MSISVTCDACGKKLKAGDQLAGKRVKCPGCQSLIAIPEPIEFAEFPADEPAATLAEKQPAGEGEFNWDALDLSDRAAVEDARKPIRRRQPRRVAADEDGIDVSDCEPRVRLRKPRQPSPGIAADQKSARPSPTRPSVRASEPFMWRDQLHWLLALALVPLAISLMSSTEPIQQELEQLVQAHPELEQMESKDDFFKVLPDGKLSSAHLRYDSWMHWAYAGVAAVLFFALLMLMFPGAKAGPLALVGAAAATGTIGIALLLLFQLVAGATRGVIPRGRGWGVLIFLLIKFVGFSYYCAMDPENGFLLSFMGFTCGVGFCEELCKAVPIVLYLRLAQNADWRGACLIGLASGVGFGVSEGIMYSSDSYNGIAPVLTYLVRFLSCVTLHAVWSGSVALRMHHNQDYIDGEWEWEDIAWFVISYLGIAMILHGLYDTLLKKDYEFLALVVAVASFGWWAWQLRQARAVA